MVRTYDISTVPKSQPHSIANKDHTALERLPPMSIARIALAINICKKTSNRCAYLLTYNGTLCLKRRLPEHSFQESHMTRETLTLDPKTYLIRLPRNEQHVTCKFVQMQVKSITLLQLGLPPKYKKGCKKFTWRFLSRRLRFGV